MSVTSADAVPDGQTGERITQTNLFGGNYSVTYRVQVDDAEDGPDEILRDGKLPKIGTTYRVGNDADPLSILTNKQARRASNSRKVWFVKCKYERIAFTDEGNNKPPGETSSDPTDWLPEFSVESFPREASISPKLGAEYKKGFTGFADNYAQQANARRLFNSAITILETQPTREVYDTVITKRQRLLQYPNEHRKLLGHVNKDTFTLDLPGFRQQVEAEQALFSDMRGSLKRTDSFTYWDLFWEIRIAFENWNWTVVDAGRARRMRLGDPHPSGRGTLTVDEVNATKQNGFTQALTDDNGNPLSYDVPLDGNGLPLSLKGQNAPLVTIEWLLYPKADFGTLGLSDTRTDRKKGA